MEWAVPQAFVISVYDYQFDSWIDEIPVDVRKTFQYSLDVSRLLAGKYKIQLKSGDKLIAEDLTVKH